VVKLRHWDNDGRARFVTFSTHHRIPFLTDRLACQILLDQIAIAREKYRFRLLAYVIMPDHVHLVLVPSEACRVGLMIGDIKRLSARLILGVLRKTAGPSAGQFHLPDQGRGHAVWEKRCYDHNCRSVEDVWVKVNYCHQNPVKRGYVQDASAWEWSSFNCYKGHGVAPLDVYELAQDPSQTNPTGGPPEANSPKANDADGGAGETIEGKPPAKNPTIRPVR
jgi:putative transposase